MILGASQGTGLYVVKLALEKKYDVTALARRTVALQALKSLFQHSENLEVIEGDVLAPETYEHLLHGKDVVVSSIGVSNNKPTTLYSQGIAHILHAMTKFQIPRLICISGLGVEVTPGMSIPLRLATKYIVQPLLKNNFSDLLRMEAAVKKSDVHWTIVRPPRLTDGKLSGKYRVGVNRYLRNPLTIGRADLAHYILHSIQSTDTYRSTVEVAY